MAFIQGGVLGAFKFTANLADEIVSIIINCPACAQPSYALVKGPEPHWEWNKDQMKPTLSPSLVFSKCCGWHGWMRDGVLTSV